MADTGEVEGYPLSWPPGRTRTASSRRQRAAFWKETKKQSLAFPGQIVRDRRERTVAEAIRDTRRQVEALQASHLVISSNLRLRLDGYPASGQREPDDPGVAVYFRWQGQNLSLACDRWDRVADNLYSIAKTIEAIRGISRWGTGEMVRAAFAGYRALPSPQRPWRQVFGFSEDATPSIDEIESLHRGLAVRYHPDHGTHPSVMAEINAARDEARRELAR